MTPRMLFPCLALALFACAPDPSDDPATAREPNAAEAVPTMRELVGTTEPLLDPTCAAAEEDGLWCGHLIGGEANTVYLCGGGQTYEKISCAGACLAGGYVNGTNLAGAATRLSFDTCDQAGQEILISLSQQRLRACSGESTVLEHAISTGAEGYETWNPIGMTDIFEFTVGTRYLVKRMVSPYGPNDFYDARVPWSMQLVANGVTPTGEFLHASGDCGHCGGITNAPYGVSHGCVNQSFARARKLFLWTPVGTPVHLTAFDLPASGCVSPGAGEIGGSCHSPTLGRRVPQHSCVQAISDQQWYICSAGNWVSPIPTSATCIARYPLP